MSASPNIGRKRTCGGGPAFSLCIATLVAVSVLAPPGATAADDAVVVLEFDPAQLGFDDYDGYDVVTLEGAEFMSEPGEPMLPALNVQVLLPPGQTCTEIRATTEATVSVPGTFYVLPAPRPARFSSVEAAKDPQPNVATYDSALPYPREVARLVGGGSSGGYRIACVQVAPLSYVPASGRLFLHRRIEIAVRTEPSPDGARGIPVSGGAVAHAVRRSVWNPGDLVRYDRPDLREEESGYAYLIVCPDSLAGEFERLADWKTRKGVRAEIVTLGEIARDASLAGRDQAESIRNCIKQEVVGSGVEWVLLGGDTDVVPAREAYDFFYDQGLPCDLYYSDLDGSWNDDDDDRWGEVEEDGIDMYSDVFVGRAPVSTLAEAASFVDKVLAYEGASLPPATDYQLKMLYLGEILWDTPDPYTDGAVACEMIDDGYVPPRFDPAGKLYESAGTLDLATALGELDSGYGIVMHEGHASISRVSIGPDDISIAALDGLGNGERGGVWYSVGCWSAAIDHDTFGEHWISNPNGGGVAYVGNSRYGWGCPGYPGQCVSDLYSQQFFNSLFAEDLVHAGAIHADAKHYYVGLAKIDDYMRYAMYELNLLGDPETAIWTDTPLPLSVSTATSLEEPGGETGVSVTVARNGEPLEGARVCLHEKNSGVHMVGETDAAGFVDLTADFAGADHVDLTVTAKNSIPHIESIPVDGETGVDGHDPAMTTALFHNYPNPFNPRTTIAFILAERAHARLEIYDVAGRAVATLLDDEVEAGSHAVLWDGRDGRGKEVASGTYFARLSVGTLQFDNKMTLLR